MPEIDLTFGCVMRELIHATETGAAYDLGVAIARGFYEEMSRPRTEPTARQKFNDALREHEGEAGRASAKAHAWDCAVKAGLVDDNLLALLNPHVCERAHARGRQAGVEEASRIVERARGLGLADEPGEGPPATARGQLGQ